MAVDAEAPLEVDGGGGGGEVAAYHVRTGFVGFCAGLEEWGYPGGEFILRRI